MKKLLSFILGVCLIIPCAFLFTGCKDKEPQMEVWDGTTLEVSAADSNGLILIETAEELAGLAKEVNEGNNFAGKTIRLTCDMDMASKTWTPIGVGHRSTTATPFSGTFDGNDHKIIGLNSGDYATTVLADEHKALEGDLKYVAVHTYHYGLFGYVTGATIKDLEVTVNFNCDLENLKGDSVGGIVGFSNGKLTIEDCVVNGTIDGGFDAAGGIVGRAYGSTDENIILIDECVNNAKVTSDYKTAGILGYTYSDNLHVEIDECVNNGEIYATGTRIDKTNAARYTSNVGGIVIYGWKTSKTNTIVVTECVNKGNLYATAAHAPEEENRTEGHHFAYIATRVGNDFDSLHHSYKFQDNSNIGKMFYLGKENSYVVCALVANNIPVKDVESGEYRYNLDPTTGDEYNNKTNMS